MHGTFESVHEAITLRLSEASIPPRAVNSSDLSQIVEDLKKTLDLNEIEWAKLVSFVFENGTQSEIKTAIICLTDFTHELDDLFGERASGWGRYLDNEDVTDLLSVAIGNWLLADLSRVGYPESWLVRGENIFKKRLGIMSTIALNSDGHSNPQETFRIIRHAMNSEDEQILDAIILALNAVVEEDSLKRFLAWWCPRCSATLISRLKIEMGTVMDALDFA